MFLGGIQITVILILHSKIRMCRLGCRVVMTSTTVPQFFASEKLKTDEKWVQFTTCKDPEIETKSHNRTFSFSEINR